MTRTPTLLCAALLAALAACATLEAAAQPAANANPRAFKGGLDAECTRMRDDYLERRKSQGKDHQDLKDARKAFKERCGGSKEMDDDEREASTPAPSTPPPSTGGTSPDRERQVCADLHARLKESLAKQERCGKDMICRLGASSAYERARTAWRRNSCGELPDDAKRPKS